MQEKNANKIKREFKIYLVVCAILTLTIAAAAAYIYSITKIDVPELDSLRQIANKDAAGFAKNKIDRDCVNESLKRLKTTKIGDIKSRVVEKLFLEQCLESAKNSHDFCAEIKMQQNNPNLLTARWVAHTCSNHKEIHNIVCSNTLEAVESHCGLKKKTK